jgi:hypothetical protein
VLARVAALGNQHGDQDVSPYGGEGLFRLSASDGPLYRASFTNTSNEQRLEVRQQ